MFADIMQLDAERKRNAKALRKINKDYMKKVEAFHIYAKELKHDELSDWEIRRKCFAQGLKIIINLMNKYN